MVQVACRFAFAIDVLAGSRCLRHRHPCTEIVVMLSGDGVLHQEGKFPYRAGTAILYQPGVDHWIEQHRAGRHLCVGIIAGFAERLVPGVRPVPARADGVIDMLVRELSGTREQSRLDLLAGLLASYFVASDDAPTLTPRDPDDRLSQADALLRAHLDRPLDAGELAEAMFISPGYLRQIFRRAYGHGPMHHLLELRVERAKTLLATSGLTVAEVATRSGFASPFHFSRVFRRLAGVTPSHWKASHQQK
ncbi:MAG: AraC family transcriptional regulator [Planctomycetota bacterium]